MKHKVEEITISTKAGDIEQAFSKMATSMFGIVINTNDIDLVVTKTIVLRSRDMKNLLFQFLQRLYDLANNELFVLAVVKNLSIEQVSNEYMLKVILLGDKMKPTYQIKDIIKQVTDRNIIVKEDREGASAQINLVVERREQK